MAPSSASHVARRGREMPAATRPGWSGAGTRIPCREDDFRVRRRIARQRSPSAERLTDMSYPSAPNDHLALMPGAAASLRVSLPDKVTIAPPRRAAYLGPHAALDERERDPAGTAQRSSSAGGTAPRIALARAGIAEVHEQFRRVKGHIRLPALGWPLDNHITESVTPPNTLPRSPTPTGRHREARDNLSPNVTPPRRTIWVITQLS